MKYLILDDLKLDQGKVSPLRSQFDLRAGILKLRQKIEGLFGIEDSYLIVSRKLEDVYTERFPNKTINTLPFGDVCIINARIKLDSKAIDIIEQLENNVIAVNELNELLAVKYNNSNESKVDSDEFEERDFSNLTTVKRDIKLWQSVDEIVQCNSELICKDYNEFFYEKDNFFETEQGVTVLNPYNVWIGEGAVLKHGVVIDASDGPVVIDENSVIGLNSTIEGPAYIGKNTIIKASTNIFPGTSIGPESMISGQIQNSILQAFCFKPFTGVFNLCYVGEWTKIEAGVNVDSDFFNDGEVTIIRDLTKSFNFSQNSENLICQYQEMRLNKIKAMKFDKNIELTKIESCVLKDYLNEDS